MKETQAVFKPLLERLGVASGKLEQELVSHTLNSLFCVVSLGEPMSAFYAWRELGTNRDIRLSRGMGPWKRPLGSPFQPVYECEKEYY